MLGRQESQNFSVIDLVADYDDCTHKNLVRELDEIQKGRDRNRRNYESLDEDFKRYDSFTVVVEDTGQIAAFSGAMSWRYPAGVSRVLTRCYFAPRWRRDSLRPQREKGFGSLFMLPRQLEVARRLGKKAVFISMEFPQRRAALNLFKAYNSDIPWQLLDDMYLVCCDCASPTCWQNVLLYKIDPCFEFAFEHISLRQWHERFRRV